MTTGFAHAMRGDLEGALSCNPMSPIAFALTVLLVIPALYGVISNRDWVPAFVRSAAFGRVLLAATAACWALNVYLHPPTWL